MPEIKPCTRCNGSGTEPDALSAAYAILIDRIDDAGIIDALKDSLRIGVHCLYEVATGRIDEKDARIADLTVVLRHILGRFPAEMGGASAYATGSTFWDYEDVRTWRKVLGEPVAAPWPWGIRPRGGTRREGSAVTAYPLPKARHPVLKAVFWIAILALGVAVGSLRGGTPLVVEDGRLRT